MDLESLTMFTNPTHMENMLNMIRKEIVNNVSEDIIIVCKNGENIKTHKSILHLISPFMRAILADVMVADIIHLPEFEKVSVESVIKLDYGDRI